MWRVFNNRGGSTTKADDQGSSDSITSTSYTIEKLKSGTNYSITVTVTNAAGSSKSEPITASTNEEDPCE